MLEQEQKIVEQLLKSIQDNPGVAYPVEQYKMFMEAVDIRLRIESRNKGAK
jgi:hypothetical protein